MVEAKAVSVPVNCTTYRPIWDACGVHWKTPVRALKVAPGGSAETESETGSPAGSLVETVNVKGAPGVAFSCAGTVTVGAGGSNVSENVLDVLFSVAVITAVVLELTADGVSAKLAVVEPEFTVTEAGTEAELLLLDSATLVLLFGATFRVTVQKAVAGAVTLAGLQVKFVGTWVGADWLIVTVAPLAVMLTGLPLPSAADKFVSMTAVEVSVVPTAI